MKTKTLKLLTGSLLLATTATTHAAELDKNTARLQAMDKITGRVSVINVPVDGALNFGSLSIVVRSCKSRPVEEAPENFAFVDITDKSLKGEEVNIFKGWMISSSPATNAVEHPIYDVWLLRCLDTDVDKNLLLTQEQLTQRDNLPMQPRASESVKPQKASEQPTTTDKKQISEPIKEMPDEQQAEMAAPENASLEEQAEFSFDEEDENAPLNITEE